MNVQIHVTVAYNMSSKRHRVSQRSQSHLAEAVELMGLCDLDSMNHKGQMHSMGHYENDEPISRPLWLLKGIHSYSLG